MRHLEKLLRDPEAQQAYLAFTRLHAELQWRWRQPADEQPWLGHTRLGSAAPARRMGGFWSRLRGLKWRDVAFTPLRESVRQWLSAAVAFIRQPVTIAMLVSASFLLVALNAAAHLRVQHVESSAAPSCSRGRIVAQISGMHEVKWRYPATAPDPMLGITAETILDLAAGLVELSFTSGAKAIIEGPALVVVNDTTAMQVDVGGVSVRYDRTPDAIDDSTHAKSPGPAEIKPPFIVRTPWAVVRDLGTEFGVAVSKNGPTEVHVFQGLVELDHPEPHGNARRVRLGPGDNVQMDGRGAVRLGVAGRAGRIVRRLPKARDENEPPDWIEAEAEVICLDRFHGNGPLAGATPQDRGGHGMNLWNVTGADWALADGELKAGGGMAMIPFIPEPGVVYRLAVDLQVSTDDWRWGALGFLNDPKTQSFASLPGGCAWMGQRGGHDPERGDNFAFGGPGMIARLASIDDLYGRHNRMVQLDTRGNRWKAKFFADGKEVAWFVFGSSPPSITFVGLEACEGAAVTFDNFRLAVCRPKLNATKW
ncbi:MAG: FecR family protein [Planctomycetia bacterium]|nr:FecR family protein [Planctomycetia bacterium]